MDRHPGQRAGGPRPAAARDGYFAPVTDADGVPRELLTNPVQFDETPAVTTRAPQFSEHTDEVLAEFGYSEDEILQLKIDGAAT